MEARTYGISWIGLKFRSTEDFYEFTKDLPLDAQEIVTREEKYPVGDGWDLNAITIEDDIFGFGVPVGKGKHPQEAQIFAHVKTVLRSMGYKGKRKVDHWNW